MKLVESALPPDLYPVGEGVLLRILGEGVPPGSPNPDSISHPFLDQTSKTVSYTHLTLPTKRIV